MSALDGRLAYSRDEAAQACGVSLDTIRRAINSGKLRAKRLGKDGGGKYVVTAKSLAEWLEQLEDA